MKVGLSDLSICSWLGPHGEGEASDAGGRLQAKQIGPRHFKAISSYIEGPVRDISYPSHTHRRHTGKRVRRTHKCRYACITFATPLSQHPLIFRLSSPRINQIWRGRSRNLLDKSLRPTFTKAYLDYETSFIAAGADAQEGHARRAQAFRLASPRRRAREL